MNNQVQVICNDSSPLRASGGTISALQDKENTREWLENEITDYLAQKSISRESVEQRVNFIMCNKLIAKKHTRMIENSFGLVACQSMTEEPIEDSFKQVFVYKVDVTDAAHQAYLADQPGPRVKIIDVTRTVTSPGPQCVCIGIDKTVYDRHMTNMKALAGSWISDKKMRVSMGLDPTNPLDDRKLQLARANFRNFMAHIEHQQDAASKALTRGDNVGMLFQILRQAPSVYALNKTPSIQGTRDRSDWAMYMNATVPQLLFALNKTIPTNQERRWISQGLGDMLCYYDHHTDNDASIESLHGYFSGTGATFKKPSAILVVTPAIRRLLYKSGVMCTSYVTMNQVMAVLSLTEEDMHPMRTYAPQQAVTLDRGSYKRDENKQMLKHVQSTPNHRLDYVKVEEKNCVVVAIEDDTFSEHIALDSKMTSVTTFDFMMPTGVIMSENGRLNTGPSRQTTTFINENGVRYTLGCDSLESFLHVLFTSPGYVRIEGSVSMEEPMVFYRMRECPPSSKKRKSKKNKNGGVDDSDNGDDHPSPKQALYRNKYMRDNVFYTDEIMTQNIINLLLNRTDSRLLDLFARVGGTRGIETSQPTTVLENMEASRNSLKEDSIGENFISEEEAVCSIPVEGYNNKHSVLASVRNYMQRRKMPLNEEGEEEIFRLYDILHKMTNLEAIPLLRFMNMGFGIIWIKPEFVQADSMVICRPSGFNHLGGSPHMTKRQDMTDEANTVLYRAQSYSSTNRLSLAKYPAVTVRNAALTNRLSTTTDRIVDPTDEDEVRDGTAWLKAMRNAGVQTKTLGSGGKRISGANAWWAMFCQPIMDKSFFESVNSPVGRIGTHFRTLNEFETRFPDRTVMDVKYTNVFTRNKVFGDTKRNINTLILYNGAILEDPDFPLFKYLNYNPLAAASVSALEDTHSKYVNKITNMTREDHETVLAAGLDETNVSRLLGGAVPKACWSSSDMEDGLLVRGDLMTANSYRQNAVITNGDTGFFVTGIDALEKFDRPGVNNHSFTV